MPDNRKTIRDFLLHSLYLSLATLSIWFWTANSVLTAYSLQLTAVLVVIYFVGRFFFGKTGKDVILDTVIFTAILLLILSSTGELGSPLFFLIYFLIFAVALLFDPPTTLILTICLALFFAKSLTTIHAALQLLSLIFISPLAIFFGNRYLKLLEAQEKIKILAKKSREQSAVSNQLSANITSEETNALLWLSLDFKNSLLKIVHISSELLADLARLTLTQKEGLQSIHESARDLLKSGEKLKEKIDRETDE